MHALKFLAGFLLIGSLIILNTKSVFAAEQPSVNVSEGQGGSKVVQAKVVIDAPPAIVWQTITNYNDLKNYLPGYKESKVLQTSDSSKTVQLGVKVSPLLPVMRYQIQAQENRAAYQVNINRIAGDFEAIKASYKLVPSANGSQTVLVYNLNITLGDKIPAIGVNKTLKSSAHDTLTAIQTQCAHTNRLIARK